MFLNAARLGLVIVHLLILYSRTEAEPSHSPEPNQAEVRWLHPAGQVTDETISELKSKLAAQDWARRLYDAKKKQMEPWLTVDSTNLADVFPRRRGNVYHNFSCPQDRCRLKFHPFDTREFQCPICMKVFTPETNAGIYSRSDRYNGTMYDGWICLFHLTTSQIAEDLGILSRVEISDGPKYAGRAIELLLLYASVLPGIPTKFDRDAQMSALLTYHREGDANVLNHLATAYELVRDRMTPEQRKRVEQQVLQRMFDDLMQERIYTYNHNNLYAWHRTTMQVALALEREDLLDWSFGYGNWTPKKEPEHRSIHKLLATHFKPDGAFWEMCSGYHLYPLNALCELAVLSRNLAHMDPNRFPVKQYDLTAQDNSGYAVIQNALHWFMSLTPPDRVMPTVGDSMAARGGMADYYATAEVGYRYYGLKAVGDYPQLRSGQRHWAALLYGSPQIVESPQPFTSSHLSSGWVSLRNEWNGNRAWVGLNALIPGGGHQHADRLTLLSYSLGELLAWEKATPYNEEITRELGTLSQSHNTVTVDMRSQKQGEALKGKEIPKVAFFLTSPFAQFAELHGDHIYPQTRVYRRSVVLIEDFYVDFFRVEGGTNFDWVFHHAGGAPNFSMPMHNGHFAPSEWLANGGKHVQQALIDNDWEARWSVKGITSRLTMLGALGTTVYGLETYPVDNAVITPANPPCQTVCVRRRGDQAAFLAVCDAWRNQPNLESIVAAEDASGLVLKTKSHTYHLLFGPGCAHFPDGISLNGDASFTLLRDRDSLMLVHGTQLDVVSGKGSLSVRLEELASLVAEYVNGSVRKTVSNDIQYDTYGGVNHLRPTPNIGVSVDGGLWLQSGPPVR